MESAVPAPTSASIIVPTYCEAENLPFLISRIKQVRDAHDLDVELLIMDDQSRDGSAEAVARSGEAWVSFVERDGPRGLSQAVVDGLRRSTKDVVVVMDADLSHPPEAIPEMLKLLGSGRRFVLGSRYVTGGTTDDDWGFVRWLNSRVATLLARPLTGVKDPMSGFFAMWRRDIAFQSLNPTGYKIALELLVKCRIPDAAEIPIHFTDRTRGESKLTLKQQLLYLQHLRRLYMFGFATGAEVLHFALVGASGVLVNLGVLTVLSFAGLADDVAVALAIAVSMVSNFLLNRRLTFGYARSGNIWKQFVGFVAACSVGALVNYACTVWIMRMWPSVMLQLAALIGVVMGMGFNFVTNRFLVFRKRHVRTAPPRSEPASAPPTEEPDTASVSR